jgi:nucleoid-associated protein Lsr2
VAKKTKAIFIDDLDGSENDVMTHRFSLDSDHYEIDLCPQNLAEIKQVLEPFVLAARRVRGGRGSGRQTAIRNWARKNGYPMADQGAIPKDVLAAYRKAHRQPSEI